MGQHQRRRPRRQAAHTPYLRADHRDRVLGRHRVIQHRGVQRPPRPVRQRPALSSHLAHRVEDPLRTPTGAQPLTPQRQHARIEAPIVDAEPRRGLPAHIAAQPLGRLAVRAPLQRLQHHHHRDHRTRHRRPAPRPEQIPEQPVTKQPQPVLGQEPIHRPLTHQSPAQPQRVQQLPIRSLNALHAPNSPTPPTRSRAPRPELLSSLLVLRELHLALIVHEFLRAWGCAFAEKSLRCGMMRVAHNSSDPQEGASPRWTVAALVM